MTTYQDFINNIGSGDGEKKANEVLKIIDEHKSSELYKTARDADMYMRGKNPPALATQKTIITTTGRQIPDIWTPNNKTTTNIFKRFISEEVQYLLGNGVNWSDKKTGERFGKNFDNVLRKIGKSALAGSVAFGFFTFDHVEPLSVYTTTGGFAPLWDERDGSLRAGVNFFQIDENHPLHFMFIDENGVTEYVRSQGKTEILGEREGHTDIYTIDGIRGRQRESGTKYKRFPIIPFWANDEHQSELEPIKSKIDAIDKLRNGYVNDLDNAQLYWIIKNAGGMDNEDLANFLDQIRALQAAALDDGQDIEPVTVQIPYQARESLLDRLEKDTYKDFMGVDVENIASGAATATQIKAAYTPMKIKAMDFEQQALEFLYGLLEAAGIDDDPSFTPDPLVNTSEEIQTVLSASQTLSDEYTTKKVLTLLGDVDKYDEVMEQKAAADLQRMSGVGLDVPEEDENVPENA